MIPTPPPPHYVNVKLFFVFGSTCLSFPSIFLCYWLWTKEIGENWSWDDQEQDFQQNMLYHIFLGILRSCFGVSDFSLSLFFISYFGGRWGGMEIEGWIWWLGWPFFLVLKVKFKLPMLNIVGLFIWSQATIPLLCNKFPCNNCRNCKMLLYQESFIEKTWDLFKCLCFSVTCSYMYDIAYWMKLPFVWSDLSHLICNHELLTVMLTGMGQKMVLHLLFASQMLQYRYLIRVCKRL